LQNRVYEATFLVESALDGKDYMRQIWSDEDYLIATLAVLTDTERARKARLEAYKRAHPEVEFHDHWEEIEGKGD